MNPFLSSMPRRQRLFLVVGSGIVLVLMSVQFLLLPFLEARQSIDQAILSNELTFQEIMGLAKEYNGLKQRSDRIRDVLVQRPRGFTLYSHVERMAGMAGLASHVKYMNASKGGMMGGYEEIPVEIGLEKITLRQMTAFLYHVESPQELVFIKHISISRMSDSPGYLSAQMQVVTYQAAKGDDR